MGNIALRDVPQAFRDRLQNDEVNLTELIDLTLPNGEAFHWTTGNEPLTYTLSGAPTAYIPFPGKPASGLQEDTQLGVSAVAFTIANTGTSIQEQLLNSDFAQARLNIGRVFTDTPDLGRMGIFNGKMGDYSYNRLELTGEARNLWKSISIQWPYYTYNDKCVWRFGSAGCGFDTSSVSVTKDVIGGTTLDLQINSIITPDGFFTYGRLTVLTGANSGVVRSIRANNGNTFSLSYPLPKSDISSTTVSIFPGCKKRFIEDCHSLYNNTQNFLAFPWIPISEDAY